MLYSKNMGINKRREHNDGVYPIPELDMRQAEKKTFNRFKLPKKSLDTSAIIDSNFVTIGDDE